MLATEHASPVPDHHQQFPCNCSDRRYDPPSPQNISTVFLCPSTVTGTWNDRCYRTGAGIESTWSSASTVHWSV